MTSRGDGGGIPRSVTRRRPRAPDTGSPEEMDAHFPPVPRDEASGAKNISKPSSETLLSCRPRARRASHRPRAFVDHGVTVDSEPHRDRRPGAAAGGRRGLPEGPRQCVPPARSPPSPPTPGIPPRPAPAPSPPPLLPVPRPSPRTDPHPPSDPRPSPSQTRSVPAWRRKRPRAAPRPCSRGRPCRWRRRA
jgi:hypothetical protein